MEVLAKAQSLVVEHAFTISIVLLGLVLLAGVAWFAMSRTVTKSPELENKARVNEASTQGPPQGQAQDAGLPTQEQLEEMARIAQTESQQGQAESE